MVSGSTENTNTPQREPCFADIRECLIELRNGTESIYNDLEMIHTMIDKDLYADRKVKADSPATKEANVINLRFDMQVFTKESLVNLEKIRSSISRLKLKLHVNIEGAKVNVST